jgi:hypothetical protein
MIISIFKRKEKLFTFFFSFLIFFFIFHYYYYLFLLLIEVDLLETYSRTAIFYDGIYDLSFTYHIDSITSTYHQVTN